MADAPRGRRARNSGPAAAPRARSCGTDRCPNAANSAPHRGRTRHTGPHIPDTPNPPAARDPSTHGPPVFQTQLYPLGRPRRWNTQNLLIQLPVLQGSLPGKTLHASRLTPRRPAPRIISAWGNGVGLCGDATRRGIPEPRMCQRRRCPGRLILSGHPRFSPRIPLDIRAMPEKIPGPGAEPQSATSLHPPKSRNPRESQLHRSFVCRRTSWLSISAVISRGDVFSSGALHGARLTARRKHLTVSGATNRVSCEKPWELFKLLG